MKVSQLGLLEMLIVLAVAIGWGVLELWGLHRDKIREKTKAEADQTKKPE